MSFGNFVGTEEDQVCNRNSHGTKPACQGIIQRTAAGACYCSECGWDSYTEESSDQDDE